MVEVNCAEDILGEESMEDMLGVDCVEDVLKAIQKKLRQKWLPKKGLLSTVSIRSSEWKIGGQEQKARGQRGPNMT